jgi:hypothetical protein
VLSVIGVDAVCNRPPGLVEWDFGARNPMKNWVTEAGRSLAGPTRSLVTPAVYAAGSFDLALPSRAGGFSTLSPG